MPIPSNAYLGSDGELKITVVVDDVTIGNRQESLIQITMVASCQDPNAEYTSRRIYRREYTAPNAFRTVGMLSFAVASY